MCNGNPLQLMNAIFRGKGDAKEQLAQKLITHVDKKLKIRIPDDIMYIIFSFFYHQKDSDEERTKSIEKIEKQFRESQQ